MATTSRPAVAQAGALIVSLATCYGAAALGARFTAASVDTWYRGLAKPRGTPPPRVFGAVWTTLYTLMGLAGWLLWQESARPSRRPAARVALGLFALQLTLNVAWSAVFFGLRRPGTSLGVIAALWLALAATAATAYRLSRAAAALLAPTLAWVTYAAYLNWGFYQRNRAT